MKIEIETKFSIGDKVKFIHSNKLWLGTIASISIDSAIIEEVAGVPVNDSDIRYAIKVQFSEDGENYEKEYGTFREDEIVAMCNEIPIATDENDFK